MKEFSKFVGLDTHQDTIAVAVSEASGGAARYYGEIANTPKAMAKLVKTWPPVLHGVSSATCRPCYPGRS